jgi:hypothetical protein
MFGVRGHIWSEEEEVTGGKKNITIIITTFCICITNTLPFVIEVPTREGSGCADGGCGGV